MVAEGLVRNEDVGFQRMYLYVIHTVIITRGIVLQYILSACSDRVFMCRQFFFLNSLQPPETVDSNEKLYMGTDGASIKHLERPGTAQFGRKVG